MAKLNATKIAPAKAAQSANPKAAMKAAPAKTAKPKLSKNTMIPF